MSFPERPKPFMDGITIFLLILLGVRFIFQIIYFFSSFSSIIIFFFAVGYLISIVGVYRRDAYGPIIGIIIGVGDIVIGFLLSLDYLTASLLFAYFYDLVIIGFSIRELRRILKRIELQYKSEPKTIQAYHHLSSSNEIKPGDQNISQSDHEPSKMKEYGSGYRKNT